MSLLDDVLTRLYAGEVSGEELAAELGVTRTAVWKCVCKLKEAGYGIASVPNRGYRLVSDDVLGEQGLRRRLKSRWELDIREETTSTNDVAKVYAGEGKYDRAVIASSQTAGRGRLGRRFVSPRGAGLYLSAIVRPDLPAAECGLVTAYSAVVVARAIERLTNVRALIKWVNDVYIGGRKVCGILTEGGIGMEGGTLDYAIAGIGVNVLDGAFPPEIADIATSLERECGRRVNKCDLAALILDGLADTDEQTRSRAFLDEYRSRSCVTGREVLVNGEYVARAVAIDDDCALILERDGRQIKFSAGEVSLKPL